MIRLVIADDHPVVLEGMRLLFSHLPEFEVVGEAATLKEVVSVCESHHPDLLILDLNFGGKSGLDLVPELKARFGTLKILIFSSYNVPGMLRKALEQGVNGYLLKDATKAEWKEALTAMLGQKVFVSKQALRYHGEEIPFAEPAFGHDVFGRIALLSEQEKKIIPLIVNGLTESQVAEVLFISKHTVHTHKKNILRKLELHTNADIVKFAYENHLV
ncbi:MAG: response regulator transcription factor [Bacteroidetes bacterium]|nr:response regulator transcription factor [Bacteroidota bacterium]